LNFEEVFRFIRPAGKKITNDCKVVLINHNICYIIGASTIDEIKINSEKQDFVIAVDAGYSHLEKMGIQADLVVGDFDSLNCIPDHPHVLRFPPEKDDTDTMIAVKEGLKRGYRQFILFGCLGNRPDHTYANFQVLCYLAEKGACGYIIGEGFVVSAIHNETMAFPERMKGILSVFCAGSSAESVYLTGLKYELENYDLTNTYPIGVSNEFIGKTSHVSVKKGYLIIMWTEEIESLIFRLKNPDEDMKVSFLNI